MTPCFWDGFKKNPYPFCEEQLCSFISEPANTWTNIGYLLVAIYILRQKSVTSKRIKHLFFASTFTLFIGSTLFHLTGTYWGKFLDVSSMFFLSMTALSLSAQRYWGISERKTNLLYLSGLFASIFFLYLFRTGGLLFSFQILLVVILEFRLAGTEKSLAMNKVRSSIFALMGAFIFWILDITKVLCDPGNHILSGHGIWHLLAALSIGLLFRSYEGKSLA